MRIPHSFQKTQVQTQVKTIGFGALHKLYTVRYLHFYKHVQVYELKLWLNNLPKALANAEKVLWERKLPSFLAKHNTDWLALS